MHAHTQRDKTIYTYKLCTEEVVSVFRLFPDMIT